MKQADVISLFVIELGTYVWQKCKLHADMKYSISLDMFFRGLDESYPSITFCVILNSVPNRVVILLRSTAYIYEGWNVNSGNYLFTSTTDTK